MNPNSDEGIPPEILESGRRRASNPAGANKPSDWSPFTFDFAHLPQPIIDLLLQYGPYLVLANAAYTGFLAVTGLFAYQTTTGAPDSGLAMAGLWLSLAASVLMLFCYVGLVARRRAAWNALAAAMIVQFLAVAMGGGGGGVLVGGLTIIISVYVMMQLRPYFDK